MDSALWCCKVDVCVVGWDWTSQGGGRYRAPYGANHEQRIQNCVTLSFAWDGHQEEFISQTCKIVLVGTDLISICLGWPPGRFKSQTCQIVFVGTEVIIICLGWPTGRIHKPSVSNGGCCDSDLINICLGWPPGNIHQLYMSNCACWN